jgi:hypothetical protein
MTAREVIDGVREQGANEKIAYALTVPASWGTPPITAITVTVWDTSVTPWVDVTNVVMPQAAATATDNVISLNRLLGLTAGKLYRVRVHFTIAGNEEEGILQVLGEV